MKFLLLFFIVMVVVFQWRSSRSDAKRNARVAPEEKSPASSPATPQAMIACARCGLHVPAGDAVQGNAGAYCSAAHRQIQES